MGQVFYSSYNSKKIHCLGNLKTQPQGPFVGQNEGFVLPILLISRTMENKIKKEENSSELFSAFNRVKSGKKTPILF